MREQYHRFSSSAFGAGETKDFFRIKTDYTGESEIMKMPQSRGRRLRSSGLEEQTRQHKLVDSFREGIMSLDTQMSNLLLQL